MSGDSRCWTDSDRSYCRRFGALANSAGAELSIKLAIITSENRDIKAEVKL